jgi:CheY-like chemotaxis protein
VQTILVVEDYDDTRDLLRAILEPEGYRVLEAVDGFQAIEYVKHDCPYLVLMDIGLPKMDGIITTRKIRELDAGKYIPIIVLTAYQSAIEDLALEVGCNKLIAKPFNETDLTYTVETFLSAPAQ